MRRTAFAALITAVLFSTAFSYSYSAFSLMTGTNTVAVNPFVYVDNDGLFGLNSFMAYGLSDRADIFFDVNFIPELQATDASMMLRFDLTGKNTILALRANGTYFSPQFHYIWENERIALQANVAGQFNYDFMDKPALYGIFSPAVKFIGGLVDVFCEINPGYYMLDGDFANLTYRSEGFELDIVPGIGFAVGSTLFSIACPIYNVADEPKPTFGAWWFFTISLPEE